MPFAKWDNFSMTPVDPSIATNPVTRTLNMVQRSDGVCFKRRAFSSTTLPSGTQNHISTEVNGIPTLIVKAGSDVNVLIGETTGTIGQDADWTAETSPTWTTEADPDSRGSFALHGDEVYYCDPKTIFVYNGTDGRRPGVPSMESSDFNYNNLTNYDGPASFGDEGTALIEAYHPSGGQTVDVTAIDPLITPLDGEKTLNTGFAFSYYDKRRNIFGKRSETFSLPYIFGPTDRDGSNSFLTDRRIQYSKTVNLPAPPATRDDLHVAVWFTLGQNIISNPDGTSFQFVWQGSGVVWYSNEWYPAMSSRMTDTLFLEDIYPPDQTQAICKKDSATLYQSGRYIDAFARPVPAKHMAILNDGTAIYFYPWQGEEPVNPTVFANHAEFSIGHPEQIGRDTNTRRETTSPLPNLKGSPQAILSDGDTQLLLTRQAIYRIGFNGGVVLAESSSGRGIRSLNSLANSAVGTLWMADEGVCWLRGGQVLLLDKKLGFGEWFDNLDPSDRAEVAIGAADVDNKIMVFVKDIDDSGQRAMVYDYERNFVSEFKDSGTVTYAAEFTGVDNYGSKLLTTGWGDYALDNGYTTQESKIEIWLTEHSDTVKVLGDVSIDVPDFNGDVDCTIEAYESADRLGPIEDEHGVGERTETYTFSVDGPGRPNTGVFRSMQGRIFKITLTGPSGAWGIKSLRVEYQPVEGDGRTV